ncbi:MAG TPA: hypothetical protein VGM82_03295 [Gemmatimonadaceae bacterium]|jgi:hypothetical protein
MSDNAQPDVAAFLELKILVQHLAEELGGFRRRAQAAEARLKDVEGHEAGMASLDLAARCTELEHDNERLKKKLDAANGRAKQMLERVRFLRQQAQGAQAQAAGSER